MIRLQAIDANESTGLRVKGERTAQTGALCGRKLEGHSGSPPVTMGGTSMVEQVDTLAHVEDKVILGIYNSTVYPMGFTMSNGLFYCSMYTTTSTKLLKFENNLNEKGLLPEYLGVMCRSR